jgi:ligand-binding sensor domain-containing protein
MLFKLCDYPSIQRHFLFSGLARCIVRLLAGIILTQTLFVSSAFSESRFDNSMIPRGLPIRLLGGINKIAQDGYGFIWLGGENGLGKYDGVKLHVYQFDGKPGGLPSDYIWDLGVDKTAQLWIPTSRGQSE